MFWEVGMYLRTGVDSNFKCITFKNNNVFGGMLSTANLTFEIMAGHFKK